MQKKILMPWIGRDTSSVLFLIGLASAGMATPSFQPLPLLIEDQGSQNWQAATLARVPAKSWDLWWQDSSSTSQVYSDNDMLARSYGGDFAWGETWFGIRGEAGSAPHLWSFAQGYRLSPSFFSGFTLDRNTRLDLRKGLALGLDAQLCLGANLRFSAISLPRPWVQKEIEHQWGFAFKPLSGPAGLSLSQSWLGLEWPWTDNNPHYPDLLLSLNANNGATLNFACNTGSKGVRASLALALQPHNWAAATLSDAGKVIYRTGWRQPAVSHYVVEGPETVRLVWDKPWVEGESQTSFFGQVESIGFVDVIAGLKRLESDPHIRQILIVMRGLRADLPMAQEVGRRLDAIRSQGKKIILYCDQVTPLGLLLGAHSDAIAVHPQGYFGVRGFSAEMTFYRGLFDKLGVYPQFLRHGRYKAFAEPYTRKTPTPEYAANTREWIHDLWQGYLAEVVNAKHLDSLEVEAFLATGELSLDSAKTHRLIDTLATEDETLAWLTGAKGKPNPAKSTTWSWPPTPSVSSEFGSPPVIAVLNMHGPIVEGGENLFPLFSDQGFSPATVVPVLKQLQHETEVAAVVIRMDSPGGSAQASDVITRALNDLRKSGKPVVISVGGMAASGGYYIATAADKIVAEPSSLIGSIGVVWGKVSAESLLVKLDVATTTIKTTPHADAASTYRAWSPEEESVIQRHLDGFYRGFIQQVKVARHLDSARLDSVAEGRVFMGSRAVQNGLVDTLGGLETALALAKKLAGFSDKTHVDVRHLGSGRANKTSLSSLAIAMQKVGVAFQPEPGLNEWIQLFKNSAWLQSEAKAWAIAPVYLRGGLDR